MDPRAILQESLDVVGTACLRNDWPVFRDAVHLPFVLITADARITVEDEARLRQGFDTFVQMLKVRRVTDYIRPVRSASFEGAEVLVGSYDSHLISHAERVVPPYTSHARLMMIDGCWRFLRIDNTWTNDSWPVITPTPVDPRRRDEDHEK